MSNNVSQELTQSAFGELLVAEMTPLINIEFTYLVHEALIESRLNNGTVTIDSSRAKLSTGAAANQSAQIMTKVPVKYFVGIGILARFTAVFTTGVAGSEQLIGLGDGTGLFFGYNGTSFGILKRNDGVPEIRSLQITTKSTTAENITITLDGDADATVAVTDATAGDVTTTANDIASHDFSGLGRGWKTIAKGDTVIFISYDTSPRTGTYSLSGATTAVGTFSQDLAGVDQTDVWTAQTSWSEDKADGTADLPVLDPTKGNVYQIVLGWLGFDAMAFFVKHPETRDFVLLHVIEYANANTVPSLDNPTLPIMAIAENTTNTSDIALYTASLAGFSQGKIPDPIVKHVTQVDITFSSTTFVPAVTLYNKHIFKGVTNRIRMKITSISVIVDAGKPVAIQVKKDSTIEGASFADHNSNTSVAEEDTTATTITGGHDLASFAVTTEKTRELTEYLAPTEFFTIAGAQAKSGTASDCHIIINWEEDF